MKQIENEDWKTYEVEELLEELYNRLEDLERLPMNLYFDGLCNLKQEISDSIKEYHRIQGALDE